MSKINASNLFVKALENEGVEYIYGIPGEENLTLLEAFRKSNIEIILTRHEQAAGFMAATYGRLTGKVGVAISTLGPGATNLATAAAYATLGGFPTLFITGQKSVKKSKQGRFQIVDAVSMMRPLTKHAQTIYDVNVVTSAVRQAFKVATEGKPGAVHIEFPEDILYEEVLEKTKSIFPIAINPTPSPNKQSLEELAVLVKKAKLPLVFIGSRCNTQEISSAMKSFIETTNLPFFTSQMGKGVVPEDHINFIGTTSLSSKDIIHSLTKKADLIINIGYDVIEKPPYFADESTTVVHLSSDYAVVDNVYSFALEIVGNISISLVELSKLIGKCNQDFSEAHSVKDKLYSDIKKEATSDAFPVKPQRIVNDICNYMSQDGIVSLDNGMYKLWFARNYKALKPNTLLLDNALATMGAGLPVAIECARLYPQKKVLAICGDGGFMMNPQEIETAIRLGLNLVVIILKDNAYGMIRWKQHNMDLEDFAMTFNNPNFVKYAESYGAQGHIINHPKEIIPMLEKCYSTKGVHIIDLAIDYSENSKLPK